ncbi:hypothetical protein BAAM0483_04995 [Bifidobacterium animalis subsp. animalis MCC 0483]|uniref:Uncharacterized protein n=1 Tax=Bifidobacterium animalis subsp. animalis MCC 0483 TaxID=1365955 RepID=A0AB34T8R3_9BIFI|nr:hypothetical protein [Bifidobacterium animalis]KOA49504.1 hypothetical protein BAAM0483_04995 [Bifidobacterium animalis subsp. animalis MCC 0483]
MTTALPFATTNNTDTRYTSARDLQNALDSFNEAGAERFSDEAMEALFDHLTQYADYVDGVWEGTDVPLSIDNIAGDDFTDMLIKADEGTLE